MRRVPEGVFVPSRIDINSVIGARDNWGFQPARRRDQRYLCPTIQCYYRVCRFPPARLTTDAQQRAYPRLSPLTQLRRYN